MVSDIKKMARSSPSIYRDLHDQADMTTRNITKTYYGLAGSIPSNNATMDIEEISSTEIAVVQL